VGRNSPRNCPSINKGPALKGQGLYYLITGQKGVEFIFSPAGEGSLSSGMNSNGFTLGLVIYESIIL